MASTSARKPLSHAIIDELATAGIAIVLISSELPELLNLSTRTLVMREGSLVAEVSHEEATQDRLLRFMSATAKPMACA